MIGSIPAFSRDMLGFLTKTAREYGDMVSFRLGPYSSLLVSDPQLIHQVLVADNSSYVKSFNYRILHASIGNGLVLNEGKSWFRQRRLIQPHFLRQKLLGYVPVMIETTEKHVSKWRDGEEIDLLLEMMRVTLNNLTAAIFGTNVDQELINEAAEVFLRDFKFRFQTGINLPRWLPTPGNRNFRRMKIEVDRLIDEMIKQRRTRQEEHNDLLDVLLKTRDEQDSGMSDQQLRDELLTLIFAGHETTATMLTWTFSLLGRHPHVTEQLIREYEDVFPDGRIAADKLDQLVLMDHVLLETMRLYPSAYILGREAIEETTLNGYRIPRGTTVFMSQWVVHRDPRFWDRPDDFVPERWAEGERKFPERPYFPFGAGPRLCIGNHFALLESKLMLVAMLQKCQFELVNQQPPIPWPSATLRPKNGLPVRVSRRPVEADESEAKVQLPA